MQTPPVLWNIYNRPRHAARVLQSLRAARPGRLYVSADGPKPNDSKSAQLCTETRNLLLGIDWPCELKTRFLDSNVGCRQAVYSAVSWFFEHEEAGIILEDDVVPHASFYGFCGELLERFAGREDIYSISGNCFFPESLRLEASYFASKYFQMWGWASWRRAWQGFTLEPKFSKQVFYESILPAVHENPREISVWKMVWKNLEDREISSWAYPYMFYVWSRGGMHIAPGKNLAQNIGYGEEGTHTKLISPIADLPIHDIGPLVHPDGLKVSGELDNLIFYLRILESSYCKRAFREAMFGHELKQAKAAGTKTRFFDFLSFGKQ
jgi:hypothetical protein